MNFLKRFVEGAALVSVGAGLSWGAPCDGSSACQVPGTSGLAAPTVTAASIRSLEIKNSGTGSANTTGTKYWFFAYANSQPAPSDFASGSTDFNEDGNGFKITANSALQDNNATTAITDLLVNGRINDVRAGTTYSIYAQACRPGVLANTAGVNNCSAWVLVNGNVVTSALPTNVFFAPVPADVSQTNDLTINIDDQGNVKVVPSDPLNAEVVIKNIDAGGTTSTLYPITYSDPMQIGPGTTPSYTFIPNTEYHFLGRLEYPYSQFTTQEDRGPFYTTPATPGADPSPIVSVTHVTARVRFLNSAGIANPTGTSYLVTFTAAGGNTQTVTVQSTSNNANEQIEAFTAGLSDGKTYTATVVALNKGGGSWKNSLPLTISNINTIAWGLTLTVPPSTVFVTSATANISVGDNSGLDHYYIQYAPLAEEPKASWSGLSVSPQKTGLTANTQYSVQARLCEQPALIEYCSGALPVTPVVFATDAADPTPTTLTAPSARSIFLAWGANGNPGSTTYEIRYSTDATFASYTTVTTTNLSLTITNAGPMPIYPESTYFAKILARNVLRPTWQDSALVSFPGSATTLNEGPSVNTPSCSLTGTQANCSAIASDIGTNGADITSQLKYSWNVTPAATAINPNNQVGNNATVIDLPSAGSFQVSITVIDQGGLVASSTATITPGATVKTVTISPHVVKVGYGRATAFNSTVTDLFDNTITGLGIHWAVTGGGSVLPVNNSSYTLFTAGNTPGTYTVTGTSGTASDTAQVTVEANTVAVSPNGQPVVTGNTLQFAATLTDPNSVTFTAAVSWSIQGSAGSNSINSSGLFTAGTPGTYTVQAQLGTGETGTATVEVRPAGPQFDSFTFTLGPTSKAGTAAVTSHANYATNLHHHWSASDTSVTFTPTASDGNSVSAAATFTKAGTFTLTDRITDDFDAPSSSSVVVTVPQILTSLRICPTGSNDCPSTLTVKTLQVQQFAATWLDQFGNPMPLTNVQWSSSGGTVSGSGAFSSSVLGQNVRVTATSVDPQTPSRTVSGSITLTIVSYDVSGAYGYPVPFKSTRDTAVHFKNLGTSSKLRIFSVSGQLVFSKDLATDTFDWPVENSSGEKVASGVYFYVIESPEGKKDGKLIIIQ